MAKENLTHVLNKQIIISGNIANKELIDKAITDKALYKWVRKQIGGLPGLHPTDFNIEIGDNYLVGYGLGPAQSPKLSVRRSIRR